MAAIGEHALRIDAQYSIAWIQMLWRWTDKWRWITTVNGRPTTISIQNTWVGLDRKYKEKKWATRIELSWLLVYPLLWFIHCWTSTLYCGRLVLKKTEQSIFHSHVGDAIMSVKLRRLVTVDRLHNHDNVKILVCSLMCVTQMILPIEDTISIHRHHWRRSILIDSFTIALSHWIIAAHVVDDDYISATLPILQYHVLAFYQDLIKLRE